MSIITKEQIIEIVESKLSKVNDKSNGFYNANDWESTAKIKKYVEKCTSDYSDVIGVLYIASCGVLVFKSDKIGISFKNLSREISVEIPYEDLIFVSKVFLQNGKLSKDFYYVYYIDEEKKITRSKDILCLDQKLTYEILRCIIETQQGIANEEDYFDYFFECNRGNGMDYSAKMTVLETIKERNYASERAKKYVAVFDLIGISKAITEALQDGLKLHVGYTVNELKKLVTFQWKNMQKDAADDCYKYIEKCYEKNQKMIFDGMELNILGYYQQYLRIVMHMLGLGDVGADVNVAIINEFNAKMDELYTKLEDGVDLESAILSLGIKTDKHVENNFYLFAIYKLIGDLYSGRKCLSNSVKAHKWYDRALEVENASEMQGYSDIMYEKALLFRDGNGQEEASVDKMIEYAKIGAGYNNGNCENLLSQHYFDNDDKVNGEKWKKRAKDHGIKPEAEYDKSLMDKFEMKIGSTDKIASFIGTLVGTITGTSEAGKDISQAILNISETKKKDENK